jgi:hypothetical protein
MRPVDDSDARGNRRAASAASERPPRDHPIRRRWSWGKRAFVVGFALFVGVWTFAFWYDAHRPKPEPLDARSEHAAAAVCKAAIAELRKLPQVGGAPTVGIRVQRISAENAALSRVVRGLDAIHPTDRAGAQALTGFAKDWTNLVAARTKYVHELAATGTRPKLFIPVAPDGAPVTIRMGEYTDIHHLGDCSPDSLQGEVVEGRRTYPRVG